MIQEQQLQKQAWERLFLATANLSDDELREALKAKASEKRFAAAYVVGEKRLPWHEDLIDLLTDKNDFVRQAARRSLIILSFLALNPDEAALISSPLRSRDPTPLDKLHQPVDFGPRPRVSKDAQKLASKRWTEWWAERLQKTLKTSEPDLAKKAPADSEKEAEELARDLVLAKDETRRQLWEKYRDTKEPKYTQAMALALAKMSGITRRDVREALAERMAGMTEETLARYLEDENTEIRRAAVLGLASRESTTHMNKMVDLLRDPEPAVVRAVHAALCSLSGEDFGPSIGPTEEELDLAIGRWRSWWKKKSGMP